MTSQRTVPWCTICNRLNHLQWAYLWVFASTSPCFISPTRSQRSRQVSWHLRSCHSHDNDVIDIISKTMKSAMISLADWQRDLSCDLWKDIITDHTLLDLSWPSRCWPKSNPWTVDQTADLSFLCLPDRMRVLISETLSSPAFPLTKTLFWSSFINIYEQFDNTLSSLILS